MYDTPADLRQRWVPFVNNANGSTIPAYGCISVWAGPDSGADRGVLRAYTPAANGPLADFAFNGPADVPYQSTGLCTMDYPAVALYDSTDGTPTNGLLLGPGVDSFKLRVGTNGPAFKHIGGLDTTNKLVTVMPHRDATLGAIVRRNTTQAITTATYTPINWDVVEKDNSDATRKYYTAGTPTYLSIPVTGLYHITVNVSFEYSSAGSYRLVSLLDTNSSGGTPLYIALATTTPTAANLALDSSRHGVSLSTVIALAATHRLYVEVAQNSGGNLNIGSIGSNGNWHTYMSIRRLGQS